MQYPHSWNKIINIYVGEENIIIIIIINVDFIIFHSMNGWHIYITMYSM
jgi:hypothetical protein